MKIRLDRFADGKKKALTLSYDDGREYDRKLVEILNKAGIRGTFHLNSGLLGNQGYVERSEVRELYAGHEVSTHTATHPYLGLSPKERIADEILQDRRELEQLAEYPVKGLSYPHGSWDQRVIALLPSLGIEYARTTGIHGGFDVPNDFLLWDPTCHHRDMLKYGQLFLEFAPRHPTLALLYVWGHSYEFHNNQNWDQLEQFCGMVGGQPDIWYATNMEIVLYMKALHELRFSVSGLSVHNPSALSVWFSADGDAVQVKPGETVSLK
jgi:peptidoglycan/xylan/chitin deacetylase (PgdA/CDA1 family)